MPKRTSFLSRSLAAFILIFVYFFGISAILVGVSTTHAQAEWKNRGRGSRGSSPGYRSGGMGRSGYRSGGTGRSGYRSGGTGRSGYRSGGSGGSGYRSGYGGNVPPGCYISRRTGRPVCG